MRRFLSLCFLALSSLFVTSRAQTPSGAEVEVSVTDCETREPIIGASLRLERDGKVIPGGTNAEGKHLFRKVTPGVYTLGVSFIGYAEERVEVSLTSGRVSVSAALCPVRDELQEVVVTAKSSKGMTSASLIGADAMAQLQPSSFGDLLELLPGGFSSNPDLLSPNVIRLREANLPIVGIHNTLPRVNQMNYNTSSMGTAFLIDGMPIGTDAALQGMYGNQSYEDRGVLNGGVDMRTVPADEIESVEVVRGIPSAEYAGLTSGLIKVKRKQWTEAVSARFKADLSSKLFFLSKGVSLSGGKMNLIGSAGYLSAYSDPRSVRDGYERLTGSLRLSGRWTTAAGEIETLTTMDYTATIDDRKRDKDLDVMPEDTYKASYNQVSGAQHIGFVPDDKRYLSGIDFDLSASHTWDETVITKDMLLSRDVPYLTTKAEGEYEAKYYPRRYFASHAVDSRPLYLYAKLRGSGDYRIPWSRHSVKWGATCTMSKNLGRGAVFDPDKPLFWLASSRPRPFSDVPAKNVFAFFAEDEMTVPFGLHFFTLMAGLSAQSLVGLDPSYAMSGKWYPDLRLNARWSFAPVALRGDDLSVQLLGGIGSLSMFPSMEQLYPDTLYDDFVELNFYHAVPDYRLVYMRTYVYHPDSRSLAPAKNLKIELRADLDYAGYSASLTYFRERMANGFRKDVSLKIADFRYYDPQSVDYARLTAKPSIEDFAYSEEREFRLLQTDSNGSETKKEGVEWQMSTPRYDFLNTRVTFSGAWFRTTFRNSLPQYERPKALIAGKPIPYAGRYEDNEILVRELLNSDLRIDSYLPRIGLGLSVSFQANWYSSSQMMPLSIYPDTYIALADGESHLYLEKDRTDALLQWLKRDYNDSTFERYVVPFMMVTNLKAAKQLFGNKLRAALFVNKLFDYSPDIERNGFVIRRNQYPYCGMELVFNL